MPEVLMATPQKHEFFGRPYTGTTETLIAIDIEMRRGVRIVASHYPIRIPLDARYAKARVRVRRFVNANWAQGPTDGIDLFAWLRQCDWKALGKGIQR